MSRKSEQRCAAEGQRQEQRQGQRQRSRQGQGEGQWQRPTLLAKVVTECPGSRRALAKAARFRQHWLQFKLSRKPNSPLQHFEKLLGGMTEQDLAFVANLDTLGRTVRMYSGETRELVYVQHELPWPVVFTMVRYHHALLPAAGPSAPRTVRSIGKRGGGEAEVESSVCKCWQNYRQAGMLDPA